MSKTKRWFEDKVEELGSVELAYDEFYGIGAYNNLKWNAEDEDEESIELVTMLHDWLGSIVGDEDPKLYFIHRVDAKNWHTAKRDYDLLLQARAKAVQDRINAKTLG